MKRTIICIILWALVLGWIGFLFSLSVQPAKVSGKLSGSILEEVYDNADESTIDKERFDKDLFVRANQGRIRRAAHILVFTMLGVITSIASLYSFGKTLRGFVIAPVIVSIYSFIDELVQLSAPGRAFELADFVRNLSGSAIGVVVVYLIFIIYKKVKSK